MSCGEPIIFIVAGSTWNDIAFRYRDKATKVPISLAGLNVRGVLKDCAGATKLTLDSGGGSPNLMIDAPNGLVTPNVGSDLTPSLIDNGARTELRLFLEIYDASTPPVITPFSPATGYQVIAQPDRIP